MQATSGPAAVEKGVWVDGTENGENLFIREALKPRSVITLQLADVCLRVGEIILKVVFIKLSPNCEKTFSPFLPNLTSSL